MTRKLPHDRKQELLAIALKLAETQGYDKVTRHDIASVAGVTPSLIPKYFGTMTNLRRAIISAAIATKNLTVLAQGVVANEPKAKAAPIELRKAAMESVL